MTLSQLETKQSHEPNIRVVVVEDREILRRNIERWLNRTQGFKCVGTFSNANDALQVVPECEPDVVLMDIQLPGISGIECTAQLKRRMPNLHIMMLTVFEDTDTIFKALRAGASGYLLKRSPLPAIMDAIREIKRGGAPMTSEIARKVVAAFQEPSATTDASQNLTVREREILDLAAQYFTNKEIGSKLDISPWTVKIHMANIFEKLHVRSRRDAVNLYRGHGPGP